MKSILILATVALFCAPASDAEEPLIKVYGPESRNDDKASLVYVTIHILEFEGNPFDPHSPSFSSPQGIPKLDLRSVYDPLTYFEINSLAFLPTPLNEGANEFFSKIATSSEQGALPSNVGKGVSGILSDPQFQVWIRSASQQKDVVIRRPSSSFVSEDQFFAATDDRGVFLAGAASPKGENAIALSLFIPSSIGGPLPQHPNTGLLVADGCTVAYTVGAPEGERTRVYFIRPQLMDPAS